MLEQIAQEWNTAWDNRVSLEDKPSEDGQSFDWRKFLVKFRNTDVEVIMRRRPNPSLKSDELDSSKEEAYLMTIFVPSTGKRVEAIPVNSPCPRTEKIIAILEALDVYDHKKVVAERIKERAEAEAAEKLGRWSEMLADTQYDEMAKNIFLDHVKSVMTNHHAVYRADTFLTIVKKYETLIIGKDLDFHDAKASYTMLDVIFNTCCNLLGAVLKFDKGDEFIPMKVISRMFWNQEFPEKEVKLPIYVAKTRALLRNIFTDCNEKSATFTFVIQGIAKYCEYETGESIALRTAREQERRKERRERQGFKRDRVEKTNLVSLGSIIDAVKL